MGRKSRDKIRRNQKKKEKREAEKINIVEDKKTESKVITYPYTTKRVYKPCHVGFCQVYPHLYVGKESDLNSEILKKIDVLVPLNDLNGRIWKNGFRGEIMYVPISDFGTLPTDVEKKYVERIIDYINQGKNVAVFCLGGHGRTGYLASLVLFEYGFKNPIHHLKTVYCDRVIESYEQLDAVASYCDNEDLLALYDDTVIGGTTFWWDDYFDKKYPVIQSTTKTLSTPYTNKYFDDDDKIYMDGKTRTEYLKSIEKIFEEVEDKESEPEIIEGITEDEAQEFNLLLQHKTCGDCAEEEKGECDFFGLKVKKNDTACKAFSNKTA